MKSLNVQRSETEIENGEGGMLGINLIALMSGQVSSGTYKASVAVRKIKRLLLEGKSY